MFLSMNWISDFVDLSGLDKVELINKFSLSTAEVENEIFYKGSDLSGIVVAEIKSVEDHPESKKLHLLKVDIGGDELVDVVCGAPNVRVGLKTAFAKLGAKIGEIEISPRKLAGYTSNGMCCSEAEIGISDDNSGIMEITDDVKNGTDLKDIYEADCSSDVTFIVEFSQSMKDINAYFKTVTVTFPDFIVLNEENKSGAIVDNATHSVTVKNVSARKGATFSTEIVKLVNVDHSVEIPNKKEFVHVAEDSIRMEGDLTAEAVLDRLTLVETEGETDYYVKGRMLIGDVKISRIVGQFSPSIDMNVGSAKVGDIPDFLNDEDVVVDLENPQIRLQLYTDLDISGIVDGDVVARDKQGKELSRVHIPKFKMFANGQTNLLLCQQEMQEEGWQTVVVPDLTRLVNKIPSTVDFELSATGNPDDMADIVLGHRYTVSPPSYSIYAPLMFTDKAKIVYTDSLIGWNGDLDDLDLSENAVIKLTAEAYSKMPAELKMEVYGLDMNGKRIPDDRLLITVNATIAAAEKEGEEKMTPIELSLEQKDRKVFRELDGIAFKITGGNFLKGRTLNAYKQTIRLDKVKLTMNGRLIADLND